LPVKGLKAHLFDCGCEFVDEYTSPAFSVMLSFIVVDADIARVWQEETVHL